MSNLNCLDTNVALRLQLLDVPEQHRKAVELLAKPDTQFLILDTVFFEISFILANNYGFTRQVIKEFIESLIAIPNIVCNEDVITATLGHYLEHPKLSFADCYLAAYAKVKRCAPLWTFDRKLASQSVAASEVK
jgi:predicted nucleic acid-binding protein